MYLGICKLQYAKYYLVNICIMLETPIDIIEDAKLREANIPVDNQLD